MAKYEIRKTEYLLNGSVKMMLYVCIRVLDISSEELP